MTISHTCCFRSSLIELNKFKKRRYHTLKNLLTGTTEVQPDLVRVSYREFYTYKRRGGGDGSLWLSVVCYIHEFLFCYLVLSIDIYRSIIVKNKASVSGLKVCLYFTWSTIPLSCQLMASLLSFASFLVPYLLHSFLTLKLLFGRAGVGGASE